MVTMTGYASLFLAVFLTVFTVAIRAAEHALGVNLI